MLKFWGILLFSCYISFFGHYTPSGGFCHAAIAADAGKEHVRIGVLARRGAEECLRSWGPTAQYLESYINGTHFEIVPLSFEQIVPSIEAEKVDFVIVNSSVYVEIQALFGVTRIATMKDSSQGLAATVFGGVIFSRAERSDIASLEDLKGKSFMAVDETSFGGWRTAWRELKENGIDPYRSFSKLLFGGTHDAVAFAVRDGEVDAGTVATPILEQMTKEGKLEPGLFKVLNPQEHPDFPYVHSTRLYPKWPFAKLKHTPNALAEKVAIALLAMPADNPAGPAAGYTGWTVPLDYGPVEECLIALRVGIYKDYGNISYEAVLSYYRYHILFAFCAISGLSGLLLLTLHLNHGLRSSKLALQEEVIERKQAEVALSRISRQIRESEKKFRMFYEQAPLGYQSLDEEGRFVDVNQAWLDFFGYSKEEVLGRWFGDLMTKSSRDLLAERFACFKELGEVHGVEFEMIRKEGSHAIVSFHGSIGRDEHGRFKQTHCIMDDITERKRAEEERVRLVTAFNQAAEAIFITDADWVIQYVNPAFEGLTGYCNSEIIGEKTRILRSFKHSSDFYDRMRGVLAGGEVWSGRIINRKKDGTFYEAEATTSPVRDKSGAVINYVSIHRDITHEVRLERELRQAQKMEAIGTLAGGIAHDFNNILGIIIGYTELALLKNSEATGLQQDLGRVKEAGHRAAELVKQILTFSRQTEQERKAIEIVPTVKEGLKLLRSSLPTTIEIRQDIAIRPGEDVVLSNPTQIHQILMNLCANAAHAMRGKGGILGVKVWGTMADAFLVSRHPDLREGPYVCITVSDTGHGMDEEVLERIFDPYFTTKGPGEGTGLGLSVIRGIVRSHGGAITVYSEPGLGTTFHVFLPGTDEEILPRPEAMEGLPIGTEHILFVDDESALVDSGKNLLELLGYRVTGKTDSLEALETFRANPGAFDLVITDMTMPRLTGKDLAIELMAIQPNLPVILCSGFSEQFNEEQANGVGIREFVMKPYAVATLAGVIRKCIDTTR